MTDLPSSDRKMSNPLVSICIPSYNMRAYLEHTLESTLAQTYSPLEVVVVDNASTDGSHEIVDAFARRDGRVRWTRNPSTVPMAANWNRCLRMARGSHFNLLSADDLLSPDYVDRCMELFFQEPELAYVAAERFNIDAAGKITDTAPFYINSAIIPGLEQARINFISYHFLPVQLMIRRDLSEMLGHYDERYDYACDIDLMIKLSLHGDVGYIQDKLCFYRTHPENMTSAYKRSKLGVMEIHRLKHHILQDLPENAQGLSTHHDEIQRSLARVCLADAHHALASGNATLARENLALAEAFWCDVGNSTRYRFLKDCLQHPHTWSQKTLSKAWNRFQTTHAATSVGAPYPLPPGSLPLTNERPHRTSTFRNRQAGAHDEHRRAARTRTAKGGAESWAP